MKRNSRPLPANRRRGATAVEMAIVAPIFFAVVFGIIEFTQVMMVKHSITEAARAGSRKAILATTIDSVDVESTVRDHLREVLSDSGAATCSVSVSPADFTAIERGTEITTTVDTNLSEVSWFVSSFLEDAVISVDLTMKRE